MVDKDVSLIQLEERERIRIMVGNYVMELTKAPIYTIQQITPDDYWRILKGIGVMRNFPTSQRILVKVVSWRNSNAARNGAESGSNRSPRQYRQLAVELRY